MANLFSKAKLTGKKVSTTKTEKASIVIDDMEFFNKVEMLEDVNKKMKSLKAKSDVLSSEIKEMTKEEWIKFYEKTGQYPGSLNVESDYVDDQKASVLFVPSDKYVSIKEDRAFELVEKYGEEIVNEETTFSFDQKMVEKYGEVLSALIENCDEIAERDKDKIIKAVTKFSVSKGTINKLGKYGDVEEVFEDVRPVISLKNVEIIND